MPRDLLDLCTAILYAVSNLALSKSSKTAGWHGGDRAFSVELFLIDTPGTDGNTLFMARLTEGADCGKSCAYLVPVRSCTRLPAGCRFAIACAVVLILQSTLALPLCLGNELGDVNDDGRVDALDASLVYEFSLGLRALTGDELMAADVSVPFGPPYDHEHVSELDAKAIAASAIGVIDEFANEGVNGYVEIQKVVQTTEPGTTLRLDLPGGAKLVVPSDAFIEPSRIALYQRQLTGSIVHDMQLLKGLVAASDLYSVELNTATVAQVPSSLTVPIPPAMLGPGLEIMVASVDHGLLLKAHDAIVLAAEGVAVIDLDRLPLSQEAVDAYNRQFPPWGDWGPRSPVGVQGYLLLAFAASTPIAVEGAHQALGLKAGPCSPDLTGIHCRGSRVEVIGLLSGTDEAAAAAVLALAEEALDKYAAAGLDIHEWGTDNRLAIWIHALPLVSCRSAYDPFVQCIDLCPNDASNSTGSKRTVAHEIFHAIQNLNRNQIQPLSRTTFKESSAQWAAETFVVEANVTEDIQLLIWSPFLVDEAWFCNGDLPLIGNVPCDTAVYAHDVWLRYYAEHHGKGAIISAVNEGQGSPYSTLWLPSEWEAFLEWGMSEKALYCGPITKVGLVPESPKVPSPSVDNAVYSLPASGTKLGLRTMSAWGAWLECSKGTQRVVRLTNDSEANLMVCVRRSLDECEAILHGDSIDVSVGAGEEVLIFVALWVAGADWVGHKDRPVVEISEAVAIEVIETPLVPPVVDGLLFHVAHSSTGDPIKGAEVTLFAGSDLNREPRASMQFTDADGEVSLDASPGNYTAVISYDGNLRPSTTVSITGFYLVVPCTAPGRVEVSPTGTLVTASARDISGSLFDNSGRTRLVTSISPYTSRDCCRLINGSGQFIITPGAYDFILVHSPCFGEGDLYVLDYPDVSLTGSSSTLGMSAKRDAAGALTLASADFGFPWVVVWNKDIYGADIWVPGAWHWVSNGGPGGVRVYLLPGTHVLDLALGMNLAGDCGVQAEWEFAPSEYVTVKMPRSGQVTLSYGLPLSLGIDIVGTPRVNSALELAVILTDGFDNIIGASDERIDAAVRPTVEILNPNGEIVASAGYLDLNVLYSDWFVPTEAGVWTVRAYIDVGPAGGVLAVEREVEVLP